MPSKCNAESHLEGCHVYTLAYLRVKHISKGDAQSNQKRGVSGKAICYKWIYWKWCYIRSSQRELNIGAWYLVRRQTYQQVRRFRYYLLHYYWLAGLNTQVGLLLCNRFCKVLKFLQRLTSENLNLIFTREHMLILCLLITDFRTSGLRNPQLEVPSHLWKKDINSFFIPERLM